MEVVSIRFQSCIGVILILIVSWFFSESKKNVLISRVLKQLTTVFIFAVLLVTVPQVKEVFFYLNKIVQHLQVATEFGTSFVFGVPSNKCHQLPDFNIKGYEKWSVPL